MKLVGITGKARAGKDTVADCIFNSIPGPVITYSLAGPIKDAARAIFGPTPPGHKEQRITGFDFTWREVWQTLGTEWGRSLDQQLWLKLADKRYQATGPSGYFVVPDIRFDNEADWVRSNNGIIIEVRRLQADIAANQHASEAGLTGLADFCLANDGTVNQLENRVREAIDFANENGFFD